MSEWQPQCRVVVQDETKASCIDWLSGVSKRQPNHLCFDALSWSVWQFAAQRIRGDDWFRDSVWPLPVGMRSLEQWHNEQCARAEKSQRDWEAWKKAGGEMSRLDADFLAWSLRTRRNEGGEVQQDVAFEKKLSWEYFGWEPEILTAPELPSWFTPIVTHDDSAWLGLAAWRQLDAGTVWALGLMTPVDDGYWRFTDSAILIEAHAHSSGDLDSLTTHAKELLAWYNKMIRGRSPGTGGRLRYFDTPAQFISELLCKVELLTKHSLFKPTRKQVAQRMFISEGTLKEHLRRLGLQWRNARNPAFLREYTPPDSWPDR